jgi:hypothetical protein
MTGWDLSGFDGEDDVRSLDKRRHGSAFGEPQFLNCFHRDRCHEAHATGVKLHIRDRLSAVDTANAGRNLVACADLHATGSSAAAARTEPRNAPASRSTIGTHPTKCSRQINKRQRGERHQAFS